MNTCVSFHRAILTCARAVIALLCVANAHAQEIAVCSFELPKEAVTAHASFNVIYEFDVDHRGVPVNVKPIAAHFTSLKDVRKCISRWVLPSAASTHVVALFEWKHGIGWTKLAISGTGTKLSIDLRDVVYPCKGGTDGR